MRLTPRAATVCAMLIVAALLHVFGYTAALVDILPIHTLRTPHAIIYCGLVLIVALMLLPHLHRLRRKDRLH